TVLPRPHGAGLYSPFCDVCTVRRRRAVTARRAVASAAAGTRKRAAAAATTASRPASQRPARSRVRDARPAGVADDDGPGLGLSAAVAERDRAVRAARPKRPELEQIPVRGNRHPLGRPIRTQQRLRGRARRRPYVVLVDEDHEPVVVADLVPAAALEVRA